MSSAPLQGETEAPRLRIRTFNRISPAGLACFPPDRYLVGPNIDSPQAVMLRSHDLHQWPVPPTLEAVGRAGIGVDNLPVERLSALGIAVFNTPGANANAVREAVVAGMLLAARELPAALAFVAGLEAPDDDALAQAVEAGKGPFRGFELRGRTLGVVGLGAVGVEVANAGYALGMRVVGFDPEPAPERLADLAPGTAREEDLDALLGESELVSLHLPLRPETRGFLDATRIARLPPRAVVINFAREAVVDEAAVADALDTGHLHAYVCDFPTLRLEGHPRAVTLPHLGASTGEAEDNCAVMVAGQLREFLEDGNVHNSVNFPAMVMPRVPGHRLAVVHANAPNLLGPISTTLARWELNIVDMLNRSRGGLAYTLTDVEAPLPPDLLAAIADIEGVWAVRAL